MSERTVEQSLEEIRSQLEKVSRQVDTLAAQAQERKDRLEVIQDLGKDLSLVGRGAFDGAIEELEGLDPSVTLEDALRLLRRMLENARNLEWALGQLESLRDLLRDLGPIVTDAFGAMTDAIDRLDRKGCLAAVGAIAGALNETLAARTEDEIAGLGDRTRDVLTTCGLLTAPETLGFVRGIATAGLFEAARQDDRPVSLFTLVRQLLQPESRRALAMALRLLKVTHRSMTAP